ncbi:hypothetical protein [Corynebacterium atypicum]|uniref:hypothetical protein n=1 Tax=Corynebacterium atypicum TaxID=191610 RepID=UPI000A00FD5C|nr:hypothetical protein [Corynebacterium atypicum]
MIKKGGGPATGRRKAADRRDALTQLAALAAWATLLVGCVALPLAQPGVLAFRDMLVLDHPAVSPAAFGFGDLPARNVPQDGVVALLGTVLPASWVARGLIVAAAAGGAVGAALLARAVGGGPVAVATAMLLNVLNPGVVERLLQGQWSLAVAAWLLPLIAWAFLRSRVRMGWWLILPASLTPTGLVLAGTVATACHHFSHAGGSIPRLCGLASGRSGPASALESRAHSFRGQKKPPAGQLKNKRAGRNKPAAGSPAPWLTWVIIALLSLAWLIPAVFSALAGAGTGTSSAASAAAFAPRAEAHLGTLGTLLTFGGMWNVEAAPASREAGFGIFGLVLAGLTATGWRAIPRPLRRIAVVGLAICVAAWLLPGWYAWAVETLPGGGLLRDAHKFIFLALPAAIAGLGGIRRPLAWVVLTLALVQAWDFPGELQALQPIEPPIPAAAVARVDDGRSVLVPGSDTVVQIGGVPTVNPWDKALNTVASGRLVVGGVTVDAASPRRQAAEDAWARRDTATLAELGVGWVISPDDGSVLASTDASRPPRWPIALGVGLCAVWAAAIPVGLFACRPRAAR